MATFTAALDYPQGSSGNLVRGHQHHTCCYNFPEDPDGQMLSRWGVLYVRLMPKRSSLDNLSYRWRAMPPLDIPQGGGLVITIGLFLMIVYAGASGLAAAHTRKNNEEAANLTFVLLNTTLSSVRSETPTKAVQAPVTSSSGVVTRQGTTGKHIPGAQVTMPSASDMDKSLGTSPTAIDRTVKITARNTTGKTMANEIGMSTVTSATVVTKELAKPTVTSATTVSKELETTPKGLSGSFNGSVFNDGSLVSKVNSDKNMTENGLNAGGFPDIP